MAEDAALGTIVDGSVGAFFLGVIRGLIGLDASDRNN